MPLSRLTDEEIKIFVKENTDSETFCMEGNFEKYTLFLYKNVVFPTQAEYSYFSADFRLKIFLYYS